MTSKQQISASDKKRTSLTVKDKNPATNHMPASEWKRQTFTVNDINIPGDEYIPDKNQNRVNCILTI